MLGEWCDEMRWYAVYPLGMTGAPLRDEIGAARLTQAPTHRLGRLTNWLDHVVDLGCTGLLLGPVFASVSHGYDTLDHLRIDPRLGDEQDFADLLDQAHRRGLKVICDGVFNHVSQHHPLVVETLAGGPEADRGLIHVDWSTTPPTRLNFEGSDDLVRLNHSSPLVADLVSEVMIHWLDRGIDGWRLDAAYAVPVEFWADVLARVRAVHPGTLFIGEVIHADLDWIARSTIDSITAYELWKAIWSSITDQNFYELDWAMNRFADFTEVELPLTFVSNHDVTRISSQIGAWASVMAWAIVCTAPGMPAVYYGDEGGLPGVKYERPDGDDEIRPELPDTPDQWSMLYPWLFEEYRALLRVRADHPWLTHAKRNTIALDNRQTSYRMSHRDHELVVSLTLDERIGVELLIDGEQVYAFPR